MLDVSSSDPAAIEFRRPIDRPSWRVCAVASAFAKTMKVAIDSSMAEKGSAVRWAGFEFSRDRAMRDPPEFLRDVA